MKRLLWLILLSCSAFGQLGNVRLIHFPGAPSGACNPNQMAINDASGALYVCKIGAWFAAGGSGTPGGSNTQLQYNNSGAFGGDTSTTDGSGNITATSYTASGATAGYFQSTQGTTNSPASNSILLQAPTSVGTAYTITLPGASATGYVKRTNSSNVSTESISATIPASDVGAVTTNSGTSRTVSAQSEIYICTSTCTVTVLVPAAGTQLCVFNGDNVSTVITLAAIGSSARYENTARTAYGTAGTGTFVSGGAVKDSVCIVGLDSTHYITTNFNGTWVAN